VTSGDGSVLAHTLVVDRTAIGEASVVPGTLTVGAGEVLLRVDRFALTSNNVTYAVTGEALQYWRFFPTGDDTTGTPPVWGLATVVASGHAQVGVGEEWYGFLPPATHVVVRPGRVDPTGVTDASPHRAGLAGTYQRYARTAADPLHTAATADLELLHRPLFTTAFLLDDLLADETAVGGDVRTVVVTSASSKTGTALGRLLAARDGVEAVGLTSSRNVALVDGLGVFDRVLAYDEVDGLAAAVAPAALVDLAGDAGVVAAVHDVLAGALCVSLVVGVTHHDADPAARPSAGPRPTPFFAPDRVRARLRDWGPDGFAARVAAAWAPFVTWVTPLLDVRKVAGLDAAAQEWRGLVDGMVDPAEGIVVVPAAG
jgi:hypothetical protein